MNVKYFYEFKGLDEVLNRVEILCNGPATAEEIKYATAEPFTLEYPDEKKLAPVRSSGAKLNFYSRTIFQFLNLHTDDMQRYVVKFYRAGLPYWIGYLDSELYEEDLSRFPPYPVSFSASDFNILERLKFLDAEEKHYTDIAPLIVQLKRCFDRLALPFQNLYIGCSTTAEGITLAASETILHQLSIQSSNFYDEDGEPMDCREVLAAVLEPFGLTIVQRSSNIFVTDLNSIKANALLKVYDFKTLQYKREERAGAYFGDMHEIGFASTDAAFGFEEMINNVNITSSPYAPSPFYESEVEKEGLSVTKVITAYANYTREVFANSAEWGNDKSYVVYTKTDSNNSVILGADGQLSASSSRLFDFFIDKDYLVGSTAKYYLNVKLSAYINTRKNPFDPEVKVDTDNRGRVLEVYCDLCVCDAEGKALKYFKTKKNWLDIAGWMDAGPNGEVPPGEFALSFSQRAIGSSIGILDSWVVNSNLPRVESYMVQGYPGKEIADKDYANGVNVYLLNGLSGKVRFSITDKFRVFDPFVIGGAPDSFDYPAEKILDVLYNDLSLSIVDADGKKVEEIDYEFKSYVNKKVSNDLEEKELKIVSCNEEQIPVGRGNVLRPVDGHYELQLKFSRAGQTDNLERLLMCTIHSNYSKKNKTVTVDIRGCDNPICKYLTYSNIIDSPGMLVQGCAMDFRNATTRITAADFSADTTKLSSIPYED